MKCPKTGKPCTMGCTPRTGCKMAGKMPGYAKGGMVKAKKKGCGK